MIVQQYPMNKDFYDGDGVFDGMHVTTKSKKYLVNQNYVSKSRLIDGDILHVFIAQDMQPQFKVKTRVPRRYVITQVVIIGEKFYVSDGKKMLELFDASVHFLELRNGDTVFAFVAENGKSKYAAIDSVKQRAVMDRTISEYIPEPIDVDDIG